MVDIYVGPENRHFPLYKKFLCDRIPYFESILHHSDHDGYAVFPDDSWECFNLFLDWVYTRRLQPWTATVFSDNLEFM
jgi:hypothetical protein